MIFRLDEPLFTLPKSESCSRTFSWRKGHIVALRMGCVELQRTLAGAEVPHIRELRVHEMSLAGELRISTWVPCSPFWPSAPHTQAEWILISPWAKQLKHLPWSPSLGQRGVGRVSGRLQSPDLLLFLLVENRRRMLSIIHTGTSSEPDIDTNFNQFCFWWWNSILALQDSGDSVLPWMTRIFL